MSVVSRSAIRNVLLVVAGLSIASLAMDARATDVSIDPNDAYLRVGTADNAGDTPAIALGPLSISAGDTISLERLGDFYGGYGNPDNQTSLSAVFSSSSTLLAKSNLNRVSGAIDAGSDIVTVPTCDGQSLGTDISQDFRISGPGSQSNPPLLIVVPTGATHLFVGVPDCFFMDNADWDSDFAVRILLAEGVCDDASDNDSDGDTDCADSDCQGVAGCGEIECSDGFDNDGDSDTDCADSDCTGTGLCEFPEATCNDVFDNDDDGAVDCADSDCSGAGVCEFPEATCSDAFDNDGDAGIDCADSDCDGIGVCEFPEATCNDSVDNDADLYIDCDDSDCFGVGICLTDPDGDGVPVNVDNCLQIHNTSQCDTDGDGYGNACDGDFDNAGAPRVSAGDFSNYFYPAFVSGIGGPRGENMSCDGSPAVSAGDFSVYFYPQFPLGSPGPSGLACAGTVPCPP